jgi:Tol biopolymer transport system component
MGPRTALVAAATLLTGALAPPAVAAPATELVSLTGTGTQANGVSGEPVLSGDGRYVAFVSSATNVVTGDVNGQEVFVRDRTDGTTRRVAVDASGLQAVRASSHPAISADGRFVAFESIAQNLVPGDTNAREDIFVKDRITGAVDRVSVTGTGRQALAASGKPAIATTAESSPSNPARALFPTTRTARATRAATATCSSATGWPGRPSA